MFEVPQVKVALPLILLRRTCILLVSAYLLIGMIAAYRAYYQMHSLELQSTDTILRRGSAIKTTVVSYARTTVDVRLELVQGQRSVTLGAQRVPGNDWGFFDPRSRQASQVAVVTEDALEKFDVGMARVRATAIGRPQWTRLPPPVIEELGVEIQHN